MPRSALQRSFATLKKNEIPAGRADKIVVTPHSGEMAKFLDMPRDEVDKAPLLVAGQAAATLQAAVAMNGAKTYVVSPEGQAWLRRTARSVSRHRDRVTRWLVYSPGF
jgi:NAD(P)H-hydrate repair Nnr-like enzyme with NAD(P)H-hydrate dehydratase domain